MTPFEEYLSLVEQIGLSIEDMILNGKRVYGFFSIPEENKKIIKRLQELTTKHEDEMSEEAKLYVEKFLASRSRSRQIINKRRKD